MVENLGLEDQEIGADTNAKDAGDNITPINANTAAGLKAQLRKQSDDWLYPLAYSPAKRDVRKYVANYEIHTSYARLLARQELDRRKHRRETRRWLITVSLVSLSLLVGIAGLIVAILRLPS